MGDVHTQAICAQVGTSRSNAWESGSSKTLNQLLTEMDGFEANEGVIVIAATNLQQKLDPALTRPGRFDRQVAVPLPDVKGRLEIIQYYLQVLSGLLGTASHECDPRQYLEGLAC